MRKIQLKKVLRNLLDNVQIRTIVWKFFSLPQAIENSRFLLTRTDIFNNRKQSWVPLTKSTQGK